MTDDGGAIINPIELKLIVNLMQILAEFLDEDDLHSISSDLMVNIKMINHQEMSGMMHIQKV
jgi:hypothetical protein